MVLIASFSLNNVSSTKFLVLGDVVLRSVKHLLITPSNFPFGTDYSRMTTFSMPLAAAYSKHIGLWVDGPV